MIRGERGKDNVNKSTDVEKRENMKKEKILERFKKKYSKKKDKIRRVKIKRWEKTDNRKKN